LLSFYPWPNAAMADTRNHSHLKTTVPLPGTLRFDGQEVGAQRYVTSEIVVHIAFLANASLAVARPGSAVDLPALTSVPYESSRLSRR
jgi:hypothetical protein